MGKKEREGQEFQIPESIQKIKTEKKPLYTQDSKFS